MNKNEDFKLKLIFPCRIETDNPNYLPPPYGMGVLAAFLRQHNYYVEQDDLSVRLNRDDSDKYSFINYKPDLNFDRYYKELPIYISTGKAKGELDLFVEKILDSICLNGYNLIGFSIFSFYHFFFALLLSKKIKERIDTPIVFGGPFISLCGHLYPEVFDFVDYMIVGDGRIPLLRLIDYLKKSIPISDVPNLIYRDNGKLIANPRQHYPIEDMPMPDFDGLPIDLYKNSKFGNRIILPYQISRGCTSSCSFCPNRYLNSKLEFKTFEKVINELSQMKERYNCNSFYFCDDVINNSYEYLEELCDILIKNKLNINWAVYVKVGNLDRHILGKMIDAGCHKLKFGIESGSDRILKMMNKGFTSEQASKTLRDGYEAGMKNLVSLITGYPYETQEDLKQTLEFIRINKKYIHYIDIFRFILIYDSAIYFNPEKYGLVNLISTSSRYTFAFDELNGLKWKQKKKQQWHSNKQLIKVAYMNSKFKLKLIFFLLCRKLISQRYY